MSADPDAAALLARLTDRGWTVAVAESLTGGLLAAALVTVPGASACFRGGIVSYATDLKHTLLGVDASLLAAHGAVHPDVARQMADGVRRTCGRDGRPADVGIATTGIAGPDSPDGQPVGTVHVGVSTASGTLVASLLLSGTRDDVRAQTVRRALRAAVDAI